MTSSCVKCLAALHYLDGCLTVWSQVILNGGYQGSSQRRALAISRLG